MNCPHCNQSTRRFGHNQNGCQRYRCEACREIFTDSAMRSPFRRGRGRRLAPFLLGLIPHLARDYFAVAQTTNERFEG
jgi:hypothetical protein